MNRLRLQHVLGIGLLLTCGLVLWTDTAAAQDQQRQRGGGGFGGGGFGGGGGRGFRGGRGFGGIFGVVSRDSVRTELKLTEDQIKQIDELAATLRPDFSGVQNFNPNATAEERRKLFTDMREQAEKKAKEAEPQLQKILTSEQYQRLVQLELSDAGLTALNREEVAQSLELTDDQKAKLKAINEEYEKNSMELGFGAPREEREALRATRDAALKGVLTADQTKAWEAKLGAPPAVSAGDGRFPPRPSALPSTTPGAPPLTPTVPTGPAVADFTGGAGAAPASGEGSEPKDPNEKRLSFNFRFAPWELVLKHFAEQAGLTLDLNVVPPGTFNYYDRGKYSVTEALDILNGYLLQKGYLLIRRDQFLVVVSLDQPVPPNLIPQVTLSELPNRGRNELLSVILPLQNQDAETAASEVAALLGPQGKVVSLPKTNRIVVTDIGKNLIRIDELLNGTEDGVGKSSRLRVFPLKHITAHEAERIIRDLFGLPARGATQTASSSSSSSSTPFSPFGFFGRSRGDWGRGSDRDRDRDRGSDRPTPQPSAPNPQQPNNAATRVQVAVDLRTNSLLVTAAAADLQVVEETIKAIDVDVDATGRSLAANAANTPQLEVYQLNSADLRTVVTTLTSLLPGIVVNEDSKARRINVFATPAEQQQIRAIVKQLDGGEGAETVTVIQLARLDAVAAASSLRSLFGKGSEAPSIEADALGRRLMVRGTPDQLVQVKQLLSQLGEDGSGRPGGGQGLSGPIRTLPLRGRDPQEVISLVEKLWPSAADNPIRVVVPSAIAPTLRTKPIDESVMPAPMLRRRSAAPAPVTQPEASRAVKTEAPAAVAAEGRVPTPASQPGQEPSASEEAAAAEADSAAGENGEDGEDGDADALDELLEAAAAPEAATSETASSEAEPAEPLAARPKAAPKASQAEPEAAAPILLAPSGGNLVIASDDDAALDRLEQLVEILSQSSTPRKKWTVFYLRSADATETAAMLGHLFPSGSVAATADRGSSLFGSISSLGGSVMDMTGLSSLGSGSNALRIVPEIRSNALFVSGPAEQVQQVEQVLKILDSSELPESLRDRVPRMIPVEHADVSEVAAVVENVYKDYTTAPGAQGKGGPQGQNGNMNPLALLMGGGQPQQDNRPGRGIRMTIGVDTRTNTLVVSADDALFRQVESLVSALDQAALEANRTVRVISLEHANSQIVQQALSSLVGRVKVSSTGGSNPQPNGSGSQRTDGQGGDSNRQPNDDDVRRVFEQRLREQMQQQRGGQGGGNSRGNSGGSSEGRRRFGGGGGGGGFGGRPGGSRGGN